MQNDISLNHLAVRCLAHTRNDTSRCEWIVRLRGRTAPDCHAIEYREVLVAEINDTSRVVLVVCEVRAVVPGEVSRQDSHKSARVALIGIAGQKSRKSAHKGNCAGRCKGHAPVAAGAIRRVDTLRYTYLTSNVVIGVRIRRRNRILQIPKRRGPRCAVAARRSVRIRIDHPRLRVNGRRSCEGRDGKTGSYARKTLRF